MILRLLAFGLLALAGATGCPHKIDGFITSDERKIWVITTTHDGNQEVYRCGDLAGPDQPPNPVCKHSPLDPIP
jgi:hypothetical protein